MSITKVAVDNAAMLGLRPERLAVLDDLLRRFIAEDRRQAIICKIMKNEYTIFEGTYGVNTKEYGVKTDTIFQVASITKPVIATLLLCLQEDGLVDLTEPVWRYLPEFDGGGREEIRPWHFLTHTSGLKDEEIYEEIARYVKDEFSIEKPADDATHLQWEAYEKAIEEKLGLDSSAGKYDRLSDWEYILSLKQEMKHKPRSHMTYCNYGYQRLKDIIDAVTKMPIDQYAREKLFEPLGMHDTFWHVPKEKYHKVLGRNERCMGSEWLNSEGSYQSESGSGGLKTTVDDMLRLCQMVLRGGILDGKRILSRASINEMMKNHNAGILSGGDDVFSAWGLGWNLRGEKKDDSSILRSARCIDHGGWAGTKMFVDPENELTLAIFTAEYDLPPKEFFPIYGPIISVLYSALE